MIEQYFPSKRPVPVIPLSINKWVGADTNKYGEAYKAEKRGLSIEEYRNRVTIVAKALMDSKWVIGALGFPHTKEEAEEYGQCRVIGIVTHYDHYGTIDWNPDTPFLLAVRPISTGSVSIVNCSVGWLVAESPLLLKMEC
jgi:hypothetical protein